MKLLLSILLFTNIAFANYSITFKGIELGIIKNFDSLKDNYLEADITNSIVKFMMGKDKFVFYNEDYKGSTNDSKIKYKKDKYAIVYILKNAYNNNLKDQRIEVKKDKFIDVKFDKNYKFKYNSRGKIKSDGYFSFKENELIEFIETVNSIEIIKKQ